MLMVGMGTFRIPFFFDPHSNIIPGPVFGGQVTSEDQKKKTPINWDRQGSPFQLDIPLGVLDIAKSRPFLDALDDISFGHPPDKLALFEKVAFHQYLSNIFCILGWCNRLSLPENPNESVVCVGSQSELKSHTKDIPGECRPHSLRPVGYL